MSIYVETSALLRALLDEEGAGDTAAIIEQALAGGEVLASSALLEVELDRVAFREGIERPVIDDVLDGIYLAPIDQDIIDRAGKFPFHLKTLGALHLATAQALVAEMPELRLLSVDRQILAGADHLGLPVC